MLAYAVPADLVPLWLDDEPKGAHRLIRAASALVREATLLARYDADPVTELPTAPKVVAAFRDATCSQVAMWANAKIDPDAGAAGQEPIVASQTVPGGSVTYATGQSQQQAAAAATSCTPARGRSCGMPGCCRPARSCCERADGVPRRFDADRPAWRPA
ncbi:hypothetical protein GS982_31795 [Rhodococcus hoagii]|nr:hypothetical protein [Prescottella equi]